MKRLAGLGEPPGGAGPFFLFWGFLKFWATSDWWESCLWLIIDEFDIVWCAFYALVGTSE